MDWNGVESRVSETSTLKSSILAGHDRSIRYPLHHDDNMAALVTISVLNYCFFHPSSHLAVDSMLKKCTCRKSPDAYKERKSCKETCIAAERDWAAMACTWGHDYLLPECTIVKKRCYSRDERLPLCKVEDLAFSQVSAVLHRYEANYDESVTFGQLCSSAGMQGWGKREIIEKTRGPHQELNPVRLGGRRDGAHMEFCLLLLMRDTPWKDLLMQCAESFLARLGGVSVTSADSSSAAVHDLHTWIYFSPHTKTDRVRIPPESLPDLRTWESCVIERRNLGGGAEETGDPRKDPPTNGIVLHDSHLRKSDDPAGDWTRIALVGGERANRSATAAPRDDAAGRWVFSVIFHFPRPFIPVLLHINLASPSSVDTCAFISGRDRIQNLVHSPLLQRLVFDGGQALLDLGLVTRVLRQQSGEPRLQAADGALYKNNNHVHIHNTTPLHDYNINGQGKQTGNESGR
ncbi:hypothetical protein PR048_033703 [Dryococelus australis]|uniref:Uncharacterized protein n=1 Tax=Dryococelus australis TaxID=614101 RepID=A0ABQ9G130_9NEOP|nr:hypothetical protein PR048_033703 [Dryococelus australis]